MLFLTYIREDITKNTNNSFVNITLVRTVHANQIVVESFLFPSAIMQFNELKQLN